MNDGHITREVLPEKDVIPPLDRSRLQLSDTEWEFLRSTIHGDDEQIKQRVSEIQQECVVHAIGNIMLTTSSLRTLL
jgi:hypothetical protein